MNLIRRLKESEMVSLRNREMAPWLVGMFITYALLSATVSSALPCANYNETMTLSALAPQLTSLDDFQI